MQDLSLFFHPTHLLPPVGLPTHPRIQGVSKRTKVLFVRAQTESLLIAAETFLQRARQHTA